MPFGRLNSDIRLQFIPLIFTIIKHSAKMPNKKPQPVKQKSLANSARWGIITAMRNTESNPLNNPEYMVRAGLSARTTTLSVCVHSPGLFLNHSGRPESYRSSAWMVARFQAHRPCLLLPKQPDRKDGDSAKD